MSWSTSNRRHELPSGWTKIRARVLKRDGFCCVERNPDTGRRCEEPATDVDHIVRGAGDGLDNLRSLCGWHHRQKSSGEGGAAKALTIRRRTARFDRTETHPGLL